MYEYQTTVPFYIFLFLHIISLIVGFGSVLVIDTFGLAWLLKKAELPFVMKVAGMLHRLVWTGWTGLVLSGIVLIVLKGTVSPLSQLKLFLVAMVGLNGIFLHYIKGNFESLAAGQPVPRLYVFRMGLATTISQIGWWGTLIIGFLNTNVRVKLGWPDNPYLYMVVLAGFFLTAGLIGELVLRPRQTLQNPVRN